MRGARIYGAGEALLPSTVHESDSNRNIQS